MKRAVLTGAGGYLGSRLAKTLASKGCELVLIARDYARTKSAIQEAGDAVVGGCSVDLSNADSRRAALQPELFEACDAVFHLGADLSFLGSPTQFQTNIAATEELYDRAADAGVPSFVFASSIDATGSSPRAKPRGIDEYGIVAPYGLSKLRAEARLRAKNRETALAIARLGILIGDGDNFVGGVEALARDEPEHTAVLLDLHIPIASTTYAIDTLVALASDSRPSRQHVFESNPTVREFLESRNIATAATTIARDDTAQRRLEAHCLKRFECGQADLASYLAWPTPKLAGRSLRA